MRKIFLLNAIIFIFLLFGKAQPPIKKDSLLKKLKEDIHDTIRFKIYNTLTRLTLSKGDNKESLEWGLKGYDLAKKINFKRGIAKICMNIGNTYSALSDYPRAIEFQQKSIEAHKELSDKSGLAANYNNIGIVYYNLSDFTKCLEYFQKAMKMQEELRNKQLVAYAIGNIAVIYESINEDSLAMIYQHKCFAMHSESGKKEELLSPLINLSILYKKKKDYEKALDYLNRALNLSTELGEKQTIIKSYANIAGIYLEMKKPREAIEIMFKCKKLAEETGDKKDISRIYYGIAEAYNAKGEYGSAISYFKKSFNLSQTTGDISEQKLAADGLHNGYKKNNDYKSSLYYHEIARKLNDSIFSSTKNETLNSLKIQFALDRQETDLKAKSDEELKKQEEEKSKQRLIIYIAIGMFLVVLFFSYFFYKRFKLTKKQNVIIETQKKLVEQKNREITDSIVYAKRLQTAILPPEHLVKQYFPNSFIFYQPKDIVAGDFYWLEVHNDTIYLAVADCTGHGVPGAMVSVVCSNALNRALKEFNITDTGKLLDKTRELVQETFEKSGEGINDGMDISLVKFGIQPEGDFIRFQYSGANNSLWYIEDNEFKEIKSDKQSISKIDNPKPFTTHNVEVKKNSSLFLYTDGLADQFGGPKGKKFKYKQLAETMLKNSKVPIQRQKEILYSTIETWRGQLEQVDDILILGINIDHCFLHQTMKTNK
jgi:tetratricopeptide (TPR) repeat protein/serine phosphatase RsbU (regulator of sigma subunit)